MAVLETSTSGSTSLMARYKGGGNRLLGVVVNYFMSHLSI